MHLEQIWFFSKTFFLLTNLWICWNQRGYALVLKKDLYEVFLCRYDKWLLKKTIHINVIHFHFNLPVPLFAHTLYFACILLYVCITLRSYPRASSCLPICYITNIFFACITLINIQSTHLMYKKLAPRFVQVQPIQVVHIMEGAKIKEKSTMVYNHHAMHIIHMFTHFEPWPMGIIKP